MLKESAALDVIQIRPEREFLLGSSAAQNDLTPLVHVFQRMERNDVLVNFDFSGVQEINGSYLRASILWAIQCGRETVVGSNNTSPLQPFDVRAFPLYPVLSNCEPAVVEEANDFFLQRGLPALLILDAELPEIRSSAILGKIDVFLATALNLLCKLGEGTAQELREHSDEKITVNGWSNRLIDLLNFRLVTRRRQGKFWIYRPLSKSVQLWA